MYDIGQEVIYVGESTGAFSVRVNSVVEPADEGNSIYFSTDDACTEIEILVDHGNNQEEEEDDDEGIRTVETYRAHEQGVFNLQQHRIIYKEWLGEALNNSATFTGWFMPKFF